MPVVRTRTCRACGGDGLSPYLTPRAVHVLRHDPIHLKRPKGMPAPFPPGAASTSDKPWRGNVSATEQRTATTYAGPVAGLIEIAETLLTQGYEITNGDVPDRTVVCEDCKGTGTVAAAESAIHTT